MMLPTPVLVPMVQVLVPMVRILVKMVQLPVNMGPSSKEMPLVCPPCPDYPHMMIKMMVHMLTMAVIPMVGITDITVKRMDNPLTTVKRIDKPLTMVKRIDNPLTIMTQSSIMIPNPIPP